MSATGTWVLDADPDPNAAPEHPRQHQRQRKRAEQLRAVAEQLLQVEAGHRKDALHRSALMRHTPTE
jgi:hypothetical protein